MLSQSSYYSHDDLRLHFGLGGAKGADAVEVLWPSGQVDVLRDVPGRQVLKVREGGGAAAPAEASVLDLEGQVVRPLGSGKEKALVFVFLRTDCPIANRYSPELRRLHAAFGRRGVSLRVVYTDAVLSAADARRHLEEFDLPRSALRDPDHALVRAAGARVTPEAAVFVPGPGGARLVYHGRIDDRYPELGRMRPTPTTRDLEDAVNAVLAGRPVPREAAPAVGCFLSDGR